ncbi:MAG: flagellar hook capping protein [Gammaproteobacteria bacterium]|nr:flagellar hook capping protein [Gammaproteobacteria bacterium]
MSLESIGAVIENQSMATERAGLAQEDFLQVLLTQLTFQDPLEPLDNSEFLAQFAQLTNLAQTQQQNERLDALLTFQSSTQAVGLIGRTVEVQTEAGVSVGDVTTITFQNNSPLLTIQEADGGFITNVSLGQISVVR